MKTSFTKSIFAILAITLAILSGCSDKDDGNVITPAPENLKIAVIADPHYYDASLGSTGDDFRQYVIYDKKLLLESDAILESAITSIIQEKVDMVLIPGDLTKDGEKQCHDKVVAKLKRLTDAGIKVFTTPGNHDFNNPDAKQFSSSGSTPVATISESEYKTLYNNFGYAKAFAKDPNSLSYIAEPYDGIWVLSIDVTKCKINAAFPIISGAINASTKVWIDNYLAEAKSKNKMVIGLMHHSVEEMFTGMSLIWGEYLVDNYQTMSKSLADNGLKVLLTGHFHATDVVKTTTSKGTLYDIATSSLDMYPNHYRILTLKDKNKLTIQTKSVESINYNISGFSSFQEYSKDKFSKDIDLLLIKMIMDMFGQTKEAAQQYAELLTPTMTATLIANYSGDEVMPTDVSAFIQGLMQSPDPMAQQFAGILSAYWTDLPPKDKNLTIFLNSGTEE